MTSASSRIHIETYGCTASLADSETISGVLTQTGFGLVKNESEADVNVIVTCTVKTPTADRMVHRIRTLTRLGKPLVVAGCMPKTDADGILRINPRAGLLGPENLGGVVDVVNAALTGQRCHASNLPREPKVTLPHIRTNPVIEVVEIASGCISTCSFCQVKNVKRSLSSYTPETIVERVRKALQEGCKEVWLTSTDNGCYGFDLGGDLPELLRMVCRLPGSFKVRVGMINPAHTERIGGELVDVYHDEKLFKFLHLPVQSGSNRVLESMRRGYDSAQYTSYVNTFREVHPEVTLSTDIIVGFPTEDEDDFELSIQLLKKVQPDIVNISKYGARPGTEAAKMRQLPAATVKERSRRVHWLTKEISLQKNRRWIGWEGWAMVDEAADGGRVARNAAYKPIFLREEVPVGSQLEVEITDATSACLVGKALSKFNKPKV